MFARELSVLVCTKQRVPPCRGLFPPRQSGVASAPRPGVRRPFKARRHNRRISQGSSKVTRVSQGSSFFNTHSKKWNYSAAKPFMHNVCMFCIFFHLTIYHRRQRVWSWWFIMIINLRKVLSWKKTDNWRSEDISCLFSVIFNSNYNRNDSCVSTCCRLSVHYISKLGKRM